MKTGLRGHLPVRFLGHDVKTGGFRIQDARRKKASRKLGYEDRGGFRQAAFLEKHLYNGGQLLKTF